MAFTKRIEIRWKDLDGFGHVNNAVFLTYLEEARDEFYMGLLPKATVDRMVLRHTTVDFQRSLVQLDDQVDVTLQIMRVGGSSVVTSETIESVATGRVADRKSTRLNSSHTVTSYAVFCLKKKRTRQE